MEDKLNLIKALGEFYFKVPVILKETSVHNYKYADLIAIDTVIKPLLKECGIMVLQPLTTVGESNGMKTKIIHIQSGECDVEITRLPELKTYLQNVKKTDKNGIVTETQKYVAEGFEQMTPPQANGSMITYYRRYTLASYLGLITDTDTDASNVGDFFESTKKYPTPAERKAEITKINDKALNDFLGQ